VGNFLRLLKLPANIQQMVEAGELSFGHGRALLGLDSAERLIAAAERVRAGSMSVRQTEMYVQGLMNPEAKPGKLELAAAAAEAQDPNVREAQEMLQRRLGLRVRIEDKKGKGRVVIEYSGLEDFDAILSALGDG
jgi:ParB family chromosome partitioning protein